MKGYYRKYKDVLLDHAFSLQMWSQRHLHICCLEREVMFVLKKCRCALKICVFACKT